MKLLTNAQRAEMLRNGAARACGAPVDAWPVVKLFTPDGCAVWLLTELDPDGELAYGLCDMGLGCPEVEQVLLSELEALRGPWGLGVAVDSRFVARQSLSDYAEDAYRDGFINA